LTRPRLRRWLALGALLLLPDVAGAGPWNRSSIRAPTGDETKGDGLLPTGSGAWEGEIVAGAGVPLWGGRGWAQAGIGPQFRGAGLRDGIVYDAQVGGRVWGRVLLQLDVDGATNVRNIAKGPTVRLGLSVSR
jgi:hypothetical protein